MKLTVKQRLVKNHVALRNNQHTVLYSEIIRLGKATVCKDTPTAYTDGLNVVYGHNFCDQLTDSDFRGVILHENLHKAFEHLVVWRHLSKINHKKANMCADYVINWIIADLEKLTNGFVTLPKCALYDPKYKNWSVQKVWNDLPDDPEGDSMDDHDWEGAKELSEEEQKKQSEDIKEALRQGQLVAGKMGGNIPRGIGELTTPKVEWSKVALQKLASDVKGHDSQSWRRFQRRFVHQELYFPEHVGNSVGELVVAVDSSGSMGQKELRHALSDVYVMMQTLNPRKVHLLYWDASVDAHERYEPSTYASLPKSTRPRGGGGTDPQCVVDYMKEHKMKPSATMVFTDGYVNSWGKGWTVDPLWIIIPDGSKEKPNVGTTIYM
jgi:predicted metal-dependent peptidase